MEIWLNLIKSEDIKMYESWDSGGFIKEYKNKIKVNGISNNIWMKEDQWGEISLKSASTSKYNPN